MFIYKCEPADLSTPKEIAILLGVSDKEPKSDLPRIEVDPLVKEILMCGFLIDIAMLKDIDESIIDWLLTCICHSSDPEIIEGAFKAYWAIISSRKMVS